MHASRRVTASLLRRLFIANASIRTASRQSNLGVSLCRLEQTPAVCPVTVRHFSSDSSATSGDGGSSSSDSDTSSDGSQEFGSVNDVKLAVLDAALLHVLELGWSDEAISAGAESLGYSPMSHGLAEGGGGELFLHFQKRCNEELEQILKNKLEEQDSSAAGAPKWSTAVETALKRRLQMITPYLSIWSKGLVMVSLSPSLACRGLQEVSAMANTVCYYAGDRSTDFSWYSHRASIIALYKAAELCLIQDNSPEFEETWQFLHRRVSQVDSAGSILTNLDSVAADTVTVAKAAAKTGLNILGLNELSRR